MADKLFESPVASLAVPLAAGVLAAAHPVGARGASALVGGLGQFQRNKRLKELMAVEKRKMEMLEAEHPIKLETSEIGRDQAKVNLRKSQDPAISYQTVGDVPYYTERPIGQPPTMHQMMDPEQVRNLQRDRARVVVDSNIDQATRMTPVLTNRHNVLGRQPPTRQEAEMSIRHWVSQAEEAIKKDLDRYLETKLSPDPMTVEKVIRSKYGMVQPQLDYYGQYAPLPEVPDAPPVGWQPQEHRGELIWVSPDGSKIFKPKVPVRR